MKAELHFVMHENVKLHEVNIPITYNPENQSA